MRGVSDAQVQAPPTEEPQDVAWSSVRLVDFVQYFFIPIHSQICVQFRLLGCLFCLRFC